MDTIQRASKAIAKVIDIRDAHVYGGLVFVFVGLNMYAEWLAYAVTGVILIAIGFGWFVRRPPRT